MIRLTLWALGEAEEEIEPTTQSWQSPVDVFFSGARVAETHTRENITSDDGGARARSVLRSDQALILL